MYTQPPKKSTKFTKTRKGKCNMLQALLTIIRAILVEFVDRLVRRLCTC